MKGEIDLTPEQRKVLTTNLTREDLARGLERAEHVFPRRGGLLMKLSPEEQRVEALERETEALKKRVAALETAVLELEALL